MPAPQPNRKPRIRTGIGWFPVLALLAVLLLLGGGAYLWLTRSKNVPTIAVQRGDVVKAFYATGVVRPDFEYIIKARTQGTLIGFEKREGSPVAKDEIIARVDDRQLRYEVERCAAELAEAKKQAAQDAPQRKEILARLNEAKEQVEIASRTLARLQTSFDRGASTITDLDNARRSQVQWASAIIALESQLGTWAIESQKRLDVAEANLRKAQANLADCDIKSPIDGIILERYVENLQVVGINEKIVSIASPTDMLMKASVDEEDVTRATLGQKVLMQLYAFQSRDETAGPTGDPTIFEGKVIEVLPSANPTNKTYEVKVQFIKRPDRLRIGMTGELNFIESDSQAKNALVVPSSAVLDKKVYRPVGPRKFEPVPVKVGIRTLDKLEILEGLKEGELIAADAKMVAPVKLPPRKAPVVPTRTGDDVAKE